MGKALEMKDLFNRAKMAAMEAGRLAIPTPMVVSEADVLSGAPIPGGKSWLVNDGVCGFAWVNVKPGNSPFANFLKKEKLASADRYYGGVSIWMSEFGQSMTRKEAAAAAMAKVLSEAGIRAYAMSRMD